MRVNFDQNLGTNLGKKYLSITFQEWLRKRWFKPLLSLKITKKIRNAHPSIISYLYSAFCLSTIEANQLVLRCNVIYVVTNP